MDNRPQLPKPAHGSVPRLAYTYAQIQPVLQINRGVIHFHLAHPKATSIRTCEYR
jgi:hypothetical protein